jgi:TatD DNase family protein
MQDAGVEYIVNIGASMASSKRSLELAKKYPFIYAAVGVHPDEVGELDEEKLQQLKEWSKHEKIKAIGEIGLDYYYSPETRQQQMELFASQLEEAKRRDLPVIIHTREAFEDTLALLKEIPSRGVIHCFTGTPEEAEAYLDLGFYISISGIVTFRAADNVRKSALVVPPERILIETDAPFLAPVPMRGKANEPAFIVHTCEFLAKLRGMDVEEFAALTYANGERAFS